MPEPDKIVFRQSLKYFITTSLFAVAAIGMSAYNIISHADELVWMILYGLLTLLYFYLGIKVVRWFKVSVSDKEIIVRYNKNKATTINRSDIKGVHVKDREILLLLKGDKIYTIEHSRLRDNEALISLLEKAYPAAIPPANVLGQYKVAGNQIENNSSNS